MGDHVEAMSCQQKAVLMSERVNGNRQPMHWNIFCECIIGSNKLKEVGWHVRNSNKELKIAKLMLLRGPSII